MPRDRSLDEFLPTESDADGDEPEDSDGEPPASAEPEQAAETETGTPAEEEPDVEPKETTYGWSPDGGECAACGDTVEARWRDGGELVCERCKDW